MKKFVAMMLCLVMLVSVAGCGSANTDNVGGIDDAAGKETTSGKVEVSAEMLEALGLSEEQFAAMDPEQQQAILGELNAVLGQEKEEPTTAASLNSATYTPDDVMAGGSYTVVLGDYMNSITLYYENGKLVKLVEEFQKSSEEEAYSATYEGADLADYGFNFIDWDGVSLQEVLDGMKDYGGYDQYRIRKTE